MSRGIELTKTIKSFDDQISQDARRQSSSTTENFERNCGTKTRNSTVLSWRVRGNRVTLGLPTAFNDLLYSETRVSQKYHSFLHVSRAGKEQRCCAPCCTLLWETVGTDTKQVFQMLVAWGIWLACSHTWILTSILVYIPNISQRYVASLCVRLHIYIYI